MSRRSRLIDCLGVVIVVAVAASCWGGESIDAPATVGGMTPAITPATGDTVSLHLITTCPGCEHVRLTPKHSGKCLGIAGSSLDDGAPLIQWDCGDRPPMNYAETHDLHGREQQFAFLPVTATVFQIQARHSGKCLTAAARPGNIVQMPCNPAISDQRFTTTPGDDGHYEIALADTSSPRYALDVAGQSSSNGANIVIHPSHGGSNQRFRSLAVRNAAMQAQCGGHQGTINHITGILFGTCLMSCPDSNTTQDNDCFPELQTATWRYFMSGTCSIYDTTAWFYGFRFGWCWGQSPDTYYDAIDRCAYWHDANCFDDGPNSNQDARAGQCFGMVEPASTQESRAKAHGTYWFPSSGAAGYVDPRMTRNSRCRASARPFGREVNIRPYDAFMNVNWAVQQGGYWDDQRWMSGDFNGDGWTDLAKAFDDGGRASIDVHLATPSGFTRVRWATQWGAIAASDKWLAGDFTGDGKADVVRVSDDGGLATIDIFPSTGTGFQAGSVQCPDCSQPPCPCVTTPIRWATQQGGYWATQKWLAGDFSGDDGKADLVRVFNDGGLASFDVFASTGTGFASSCGEGGSQAWSRWGTQQGGYWDDQKWLAGHFMGGSKAKLARVFNDEGQASVDVFTSLGCTGTTFARWITRDGPFSNAQGWVAEDYDDDGRTDLARAFYDNGYDSIGVNRSIDGGGLISIDLWALRDGLHRGAPPLPQAVREAQKWLGGKFNGVGNVAKVYDDGRGRGGAANGQVTIDVFVR